MPKQEGSIIKSKFNYLQIAWRILVPLLLFYVFFYLSHPETMLSFIYIMQFVVFMHIVGLPLYLYRYSDSWELFDEELIVRNFYGKIVKRANYSEIHRWGEFSYPSRYSWEELRIYTGRKRFRLHSKIHRNYSEVLEALVNIDKVRQMKTEHSGIKSEIRLGMIMIWIFLTIIITNMAYYFFIDSSAKELEILLIINVIFWPGCFLMDYIRKSDYNQFINAITTHRKLKHRKNKK